MLGVFSKLLYVLTFGPFQPQSEFWKVPGLDGENGEFPTLTNNKSGTGTGIKTRTRRMAMPIGGINALSNLALKKMRDTQPDSPTGLTKQDITNLSRLKDLAISGLGALISRFALSLVENETLVFLFGFSYAVHLVAAFFSILELFVGQEKNAEHGKFWDLIEVLVNFGGVLFNTGVIASIFYYFYPPRPTLRVDYVQVPVQVLPPTNPTPTPTPAVDENPVIVEHKP